MTDAEILQKTMSNTAQRIIDKNSNVPRIYTAIVDTVNSDGTVTVHLPSDISSQKMTFPNLSSFTPDVGKGVYILTTGETSLTGGFIIATSGKKTTFLNDLYNTMETLISQVNILQTQIETLENNK